MAAKLIYPKDEQAALKYATKAPFVRGETTYWHNSLNGFLEGIKYARKLQQKGNKNPIKDIDFVPVLAQINKELASAKSYTAYKESQRKVHRADTSYDANGYGDSYIPFCTGFRNLKRKVSYDESEITCKLCLKFKKVQYSK